MKDMIGKFEIKDNDRVIKYSITDNKVEKIMKKLINYYIEHGFCGEVIQRSDDAQIEAPYILLDIADNIIKFECKYTDL